MKLLLTYFLGLTCMFSQNTFDENIHLDCLRETFGFKTTNAPAKIIKEVAKDIYKDYPEILKILGL